MLGVGAVSWDSVVMDGKAEKGKGERHGDGDGK
jgi:hypothetical protein